MFRFLQYTFLAIMVNSEAELVELAILFNVNKLPLNVDNTTIMIFTNRTINENLAITIYNKKIEWVTSIKVFGCSNGWKTQMESPHWAY